MPTPSPGVKPTGAQPRRDPAAAAAVASDTARPPRILLVDDDPVVRESLAEVLLETGYRCLSAGGGLQALSLVARHAPDLVLLDLNLLGQSGWDTFVRLKVERPSIPVVIVTARPDQRSAAERLGANAFFEKPVDIPALLEVIALLLPHWHPAVAA